MIAEIDEKLDLFFTKGSLRYCDYTIWDEVFAIAGSYENTKPEYYHYEIKRLRDLKNTYDCAYNEGKIKSAKAAAQKGLSTVESINVTGISENEINKL